MAALDRVRARNFRNLAEFEIEPGPGINWILGDNAAGKTALLETIYCLSRRRSFRGRRFGPLVAFGAVEAKVEAWLGGVFTPVTMRWSVGSRSEAARNGADEVDRRFSVRLICEATHALVEGEPSLRRRFLDWNVLLWEPESVVAFRRFRRVSAQRNAWLKRGGTGSPVWDLAYVEALVEVLERRSRFFDELVFALAELTRREQWFEDVELRCSRLEPDRGYVLDRLKESLSLDIDRGYTYLTPSRWDFGFVRGGGGFAGSRGEGKVLGFLLQLAAESVVFQKNGRSSVWLVDDIDAELAPEWSARVVELLSRSAVQLFVTSLPGKLELARSRVKDSASFHVEQGSIRSGHFN
jgi:DNA replication and repair protein RecF